MTREERINEELTKEFILYCDPDNEPDDYNIDTIIDYITSEGVDINAQLKEPGYKSSCALHFLAWKNDYEALEIMLEAGCNPNILDDEGKDALFWLYKGGIIKKKIYGKDYLNSIKLLLKFDANPKILKDYLGNYISDHIKDEEIVSLLELIKKYENEE